MLHMIIGKDWTANRARILDQIAEDVKAKQGGRILLVPELISHDMERRLSQAAGDTSSRYAEVLSFTRLCRRVNDSAHFPAMQCLDNGGRVVAMAAACRSLHSRLKAYAAVETKPEFLTGLVDAVDEFKRCCITPADLKAAAEHSDGSLSQKLEELAMILEAYDALCVQGKRDPRDQETALLERLEDCEFAQEHVFYIDGFPDFTRQHFAILEHLIQYSAEVTVSVNCDCISSSAMAFEKAGSTASELIRCAQKAGVAYEIVELPYADNRLNPMRERLFQGQIATKDELNSCIHVYQAESVHHECVSAAERVLALVRQGNRFRDISLVCCDMGTYQNTANMVFQSCNIPLYQSGTENILQKSVISAVLSAVDTVLSGFEQRDMLRYLKSVLSPLNADQCDRVENYAILWGIRGNQWLSPWKNHPDGLSEPWTDSAYARLEQLERCRRMVVDPLYQLSEGFHKAKNLAQQVEALYSFLQEMHFARRLERLAVELDESGDNRSAQILNQLWEILLSALEQLHDVLGQTHWEDQSFSRLLTLLLGQYDVGTIPPVLDAVMMGPVSAMRCQEPKHLIVLGAEEGSLPGYGGTQGVLTDQERVALRKMGVPLTGGSLDGLQAEFAEIYGVFCGAQETVTVFTSSGQPSFVCQRLGQMSGGIRAAEGKYGAALANPMAAASYFARWNAHKEAINCNIDSQYLDIINRRDHQLGSISREQIDRLYGSKLNLSASQVDRAAECRMSYFLKYGLRARERKEATIDPAEYGTFVHYVLEHTAKDVMEQGGFHQVTLEQTMDLAHGHAKEYAAEHFDQLESNRIAYLFQRNNQELELVVRELWQELHIAAFEPVDFETDFGGEGGLPAIEIPGNSMEAQLRGFVDRVDAWREMGRNYFRVVDYKTGKKDFDYCDVFNGIGLQMLLYLFALEQGGAPVLGESPIPAGVQYFPARVPLVPSDGRVTEEEAELLRLREWKRKGLLLSDEDVLLAMEPEDAPNRIGVTRKKDGTISGDLADRQQMKMLKDYVFICLGRLVDDIASGNVTPNPYTRGTSHDACAFCPYGVICHKAEVEGRRNYKAMQSQRFWEEIQKEVDRHG